jgi:two-component system cell cycle sensor histidine kinase/response regulator CckA
MARGDDDLGGGEAFIRVPAATLARLERLATASLLATGLAHEIANPLQALVVAHDGIAQQLNPRDDAAPRLDPSDGIAEDLEMAIVCTRAIAALVRDFQYFLRPDEHKTPAPIVSEVRPAVERALQMARSRLSAVASLSITIVDPPPVAMPSSRITQIVLNLLLNAADVLGDGPGARRANLVEVRVGALDGDGRPFIEVQDNGPGLDPVMQTALFEIGRTTKRGSLGLGLAISRQLARASGGDITAAPAPQRGTIFRVTLGPQR